MANTAYPGMTCRILDNVKFISESMDTEVASTSAAVFRDCTRGSKSGGEKTSSRKTHRVSNDQCLHPEGREVRKQDDPDKML